MSESPLSYTVRARTTASSVSEVAFGSEVVRFDTSWGSEPSGLPGPAELLAASFSACLLKNLERSGQLLGFPYQGADVEVVARRQDDPPQFVEISYLMRISTTEPQRRVDLVHRNLRKFGTVFNTLAASCEIHGEVLAVAPAQVDAASN